ncbi:MAG: hypothetical protein ABR927_08095 [Bacteroidales bacterium]
MNNPNLLFEFILLILKSKYPTNKLINAHKRLVKGDESPLPGGSANGFGKAFPEILLTKCGTTFVKNTPAKNPECNDTISLVLLTICLFFP